MDSDMDEDDGLLLDNAKNADGGLEVRLYATSEVECGACKWPALASFFVPSPLSSHSALSYFCAVTLITQPPLLLCWYACRMRRPTPAPTSTTGAGA